MANKNSAMPAIESIQRITQAASAVEDALQGVKGLTSKERRMVLFSLAMASQVTDLLSEQRQERENETKGKNDEDHADNSSGEG